LYSGTSHEQETLEKKVLGMEIDATVIPGIVGGQGNGIISKLK
jgi:hypothetical protein